MNTARNAGLSEGNMLTNSPRTMVTILFSPVYPYGMYDYYGIDSGAGNVEND